MLNMVKDRYRSIWREILWKSFKYRSPNLVNAEYSEELEEGNLYVYATFMRLGKQHYVVKHRGETYPHSCLARHREEDIWDFKKKVNTIWVTRTFEQ